MGFCVYVPLPPLRGQHTALCHPRWLPPSGLTEFAVCWGGAGFEPRTTDLPFAHISRHFDTVDAKQPLSQYVLLVIFLTLRSTSS